MSLSELKMLFAVLVFISGGFGVLIPWALGGGAPSKRFMVWGDTFAGGVLAAAGLVHLLSAGASHFHLLAPGLTFPLAFVLAGAGFLLILLIEAVIVADPDPAESPLHCGSRGASHEIGPQPHGVEPRPVVFVLLLVLSIHSIIVGMALGSQSSLSGALIVFIAIVAHKSVAGFALGVSYRRAGFSLRRTAPIVFFDHDSIGHLGGHCSRGAGFCLLPSTARGDLRFCRCWHIPVHCDSGYFQDRVRASGRSMAEMVACFGGVRHHDRPRSVDMSPSLFRGVG